MPDPQSTIFETVIGLEVHLQFKTRSKIFCGCLNEFGKEPNTNTCPVCLGLPGTLPVLNQQALRYAVKVGLALNCEISPYIKFDRKNYYYPDLPKGFQISQYDFPVARSGSLAIPTPQGEKIIRIHRAHLEEDAGKLIHDPVTKCSLVDYNRTGTPLLEIVTEPDIRSAQEAIDYLATLKLLLEYLDVSNCDMEKGSLRCDANISIRPQGETRLGVKAELKNMNSFKAVRSALIYEENRQRQLALAGQKLHQETRLWDENKAATFPMRSKEEAHDYRYFPEPDLTPVLITPGEIAEIKQSLPELPTAKKQRFLKIYRLSDYDAQILVQDRLLADFFEACAKIYPHPKKITNWIIGPLQQELNARRCRISEISLTPSRLMELITKVEEGIISQLAGKNILKIMLDSPLELSTIITEQGLAQVSDEGQLEQYIDQVLNENTNVAAQVREGKESALGFLVGQTMKKTQGKANPKKVGEIIKRRLSHD